MQKQLLGLWVVLHYDFGSKMVSHSWSLAPPHLISPPDFQALLCILFSGIYMFIKKA